MQTYRAQHEFAVGRGKEEAGDALEGEAVTSARDDPGEGLGLLEEEVQVIQDLIFGDVLGTPEDVGFGGVGESELVDVDVGAEGDEADEGIVGEEIDGLREGGFEEEKLLLDHTRVDDEEEDGREGRRIGGGGSAEVFDGGVLVEELGGEVGFGDGGVVRGEVVALEAERADPDLGGEIGVAEGVEDGSAGAAAEGGVRNEGRRLRRGERLERGVDCRDGDDAVVGFLLRAWKYVPWHANSIYGFDLYEFRHLPPSLLSLTIYMPFLFYVFEGERKRGVFLWSRECRRNRGDRKIIHHAR